MPPSPPEKSRADHAVALLRRRIIAGESAPGALLAESAVAQQLGVSRVPVREALFTLEREGLVEFSETGRAYVKELSPQDFEELLVLRVTLESLAARLAAPVIRQDAAPLLKNLAATRKARTLGEVTRLDMEFHETILKASGNSRLLKLWSSLRHELELWLGRLHRSKQNLTRGTREETVVSHGVLVDCFRTQSPAACEHQMRVHILGWREWLPVLPPRE